MYILQQNSIFLLNLGELREAAAMPVNSMGCISLPMGFMLQTPAIGVVSNVRRKNEQKLVLVSRRRNYVNNALSASQIERDNIVKEDTKFKSSFDKYLKAMESIRIDREKKKVKGGSGPGKKHTDVAFSKDVPKHRKRGENVQETWLKKLDSKEGDKRSERFKGVAVKKKVGGRVQARSNVAFSKDVPQHRKRGETIQETWLRRSDSKEGDIFPEKFEGVAEKKEVGGRVQARRNVAFSKGVPQLQKRGETFQKTWLKRSDFKEGDKCSESFEGVAKKKEVGGKVQARSNIAFSKDVPQLQKRGETFQKTWVKRSDSREGDKCSESFERVAKKKEVGGKVQARSNVAFSKDVPQHQKQGETVLKKWIKRLDSKEGGKFFERFEGVAEKKEVGKRVQARSSVGPQKVLSYVGSKTGLSKKLDVDTTASTKTKFIKEKSMPVNEMSVDDDLGMERFIFQQSELLNGDLDGPRVSKMIMDERIENLAKCLNDADMDMPEWMFAKTMRSARIRYSDHSMFKVIQILGKYGNWRRVLQLIDWLQMQERYKSNNIRYVYTAALGVLGKARRPVEALNLFCTMQRHKTTYPDIVTYRSIAVTLGQVGHMKELFEVIDNMRSMPKNFKVEDHDDWDPRLEPDIVIYHAVLNGCVKSKQWEGAVWVLQKLEEIGQQPTSTTYGLAMEVMLACGKYDLVYEYFKEVQRFTVPSALTYRVLVNTLWKEGKPDEAIAVVQDMEYQGQVGPASLYYDLARCLCSVGRCEEALMQVDKICKVASKPLVVTFTGLIQACLSSGNIHDATYIFNYMQKYCSPNTATCNIMLKAYLGYGMFDEAKEIFKKMIQSGQESRKIKSGNVPDASTFNTMLEACIREERWDDFEYAYEQMLLHGHPFNTKRHLWMVLKASAAGKVEAVEATWRHLVQIDHIPPPKLVTERFRLKMEDDNLVEAVSSVACHPSSHQQSFSKEAWLKLFEENAHCFKKEALEHLISEVNKSLAKSETPNLIFQNLLDSCMEFVRDDNLVASST
ncbi:pentatricopeptide repeat-containing protein At1g30610, chloroplastic-like isoform X2 [Chenopodium quinoa]|uniref:pentatricopeptide repeat-containing protein At1g30610, chloroplastic-like isoform X2 n=1 Tax=Chenopodium quinoa TaxID=63459 RepID=UPI000B784915|nr:pentatricopeptide repeat-containing protein At1g30610, chloroplastic-like isoform X2 [Chenopodium quinoa]